MKPQRQFLRLLLATVGSVWLAGCLNLKPARSTTRHFVLAATAVFPDGSGAPAAPCLAVGLGPVKVPGYLFRTSMAVRSGPTEVEYLDNAQWAERIDTGCQRVLAANLATLLPSDRIRRSAWRPQEVACEVQVAFDQFEVDTVGRGVLVARWRITSAESAALLKAGASRLTKPGPAPADNPEGAAATLSDLLADLSRELADAVRTCVAGSK